ncbi:MAG: hypothetical protein ABFC57_03290 [Veillonellales bacterium]
MESQIIESIQELALAVEQVAQALQPSWTIQGWSDVSAIATGASAACSLFIAVLTWQYVKAANKTVTEMTKARIEASRPIVIVDYEFESGLIYLYIENLGQTTARDIVVDIPEKIIIRGYEKDVRDLLFKEPIKSFPPKRKVRTIINVSREMNEKNGYVLKQDIKVSYNDGNGNYWDEPSTLNYEIYKSTLYADSNEMKITNHLEAISESMNIIQQAVNPEKPLEGLAALQALPEIVNKMNKV